MLTNKDKTFIEKTAKRLQELIGIEREPNIYNYTNICKFINDLKYSIVFNSDGNYTIKNAIHLECKEPNKDCSDDEYIKFQKDLLYQIWEITKKKCKIPMIKFNELDAKYFFRAMLMPEKIFVEEVIKNTGLDGMCNIFKVAKKFHVDYMEVIARGNELDIWNRK